MFDVLLYCYLCYIPFSFPYDILEKIQFLSCIHSYSSKAIFVRCVYVFISVLKCRHSLLGVQSEFYKYQMRPQAVLPEQRLSQDARRGAATDVATARRRLRRHSQTNSLAKHQTPRHRQTRRVHCLRCRCCALSVCTIVHTTHSSVADCRHTATAGLLYQQQQQVFRIR